MHEVIGSIPIVSTKIKTDVIGVRFYFCKDLFERNNSRIARIWFAFPPKSASSSLVSGKARNIAILGGTMRMANANCLYSLSTDVIDVRFYFGKDLFERNNSRIARNIRDIKDKTSLHSSRNVL